jgi:hypothetical protein
VHGFFNGTKPSLLELWDIEKDERTAVAVHGLSLGKRAEFSGSFAARQKIQ